MSRHVGAKPQFYIFCGFSYLDPTTLFCRDMSPVMGMNPAEQSESARTLDQPSDLVDEYSVAQFYLVSVATVRRWRERKTGPIFRRITDRLIRYRRSDLEAYLASCGPDGTSRR